MRSLATVCLVLAMVMVIDHSYGFTLNMQESAPSRRVFMSKATSIVVTSVGLGSAAPPAFAAPEIFTTQSGIKYATLKPATGKGNPIDKDIVAVEYTAYLMDGSIFGESH